MNRLYLNRTSEGYPGDGYGVPGRFQDTGRILSPAGSPGDGYGIPGRFTRMNTMDTEKSLAPIMFILLGLGIGILISKS